MGINAAWASSLTSADNLLSISEKLEQDDDGLLLSSTSRTSIMSSTSMEPPQLHSASKDNDNEELELSEPFVRRRLPRNNSIKSLNLRGSLTERSLSLRQRKSTISINGSGGGHGRPNNLSKRLSKLVEETHSYKFLLRDDKKKVHIQGSNQWWKAVFGLSLISLAACLVTLWAPYPVGARMPSEEVAKMPWSNGCRGLSTCICPRETICADDLLSMIFLTLSRCSAWFDYPLYMLLFLSKARNLNNYLQHTMFKCWINFADFHEVHAMFGVIVGFETTSHAFFHLLRWSRRYDDIELLWSSQTGITGMICMIIMPLIVLPMVLPMLKDRLTFEWRKGLHYLSVVWAMCLMFHAPQRIFWLIGVPLLLYLVDSIYGLFHKTYLIENAYFERMGQSVFVTFKNPSGFDRGNSSYLYLMLPFLSKYQFHAFSVYPSKKSGHSELCISKAGSWTGDLMNEISSPTHRPMFVVGPYLSPFNSQAMDSTRLIAIASGIGITPIVSLMKQYINTERHLNLIWSCRDPSLVEFLLNNWNFCEHGESVSLIFYTGKQSLLIDKELPKNMRIYVGRPNFQLTINAIVSMQTQHDSLDNKWSINGALDDANAGLKRVYKTSPGQRARILLEKALDIYSMDQLFEFALKSCASLVDEPQFLMEDKVDYGSVKLLLENLLKESYDCTTTDVIQQSFDIHNTVEPHLLSRDEFQLMFASLVGTNKDDCGQLDDSNIIAPLDEESGLADFDMLSSVPGKATNANDWGLFYCGGSKPILDQLKIVSKKTGIGLSVEKFNW